jgi:hypothetical protein
VLAVPQRKISSCENLILPRGSRNYAIAAELVGQSVAGAISMHTDSKRAYSIELRHISEALISCGYTSLDEQAKALGVHRNTAWTIINNKHKLGRLSNKTIGRILANPLTPPAVSAVLLQYLAERCRAVQRKRNRLTPFLESLARTKEDLF